MTLTDLAKTSLGNLGRHRVRTILSAVGVTVGILTIVTMVSLGIGVRREFVQTFQQAGLETVRVRPVTEERTAFNQFAEPQRTVLITPALVEEMRARDDVLEVRPRIFTPGGMDVSLKIGEEMLRVRVGEFHWGMNDPFTSAPEIVAGAELDREGQGDIVVTASALEELGFEGAPSTGSGQAPSTGSGQAPSTGSGQAPSTGSGQAPSTGSGQASSTGSGQRDFESIIGQDVELVLKAPRGDTQTFPFRVVGVLETNYGPESGYFGTHIGLADAQAIKAWWYNDPDILENEGYDELTIEAASLNDAVQIVEVLEARGFEVQSLQTMLDMVNKGMVTMLGSIGGLALLVASLGIANTMIMAVYERTREIGILKAIGASPGDIRVLFMAEAALIGLLGGVVGTIIGWLLGLGLNRAILAYLQWKEIPVEGTFFVVTAWLVLLALAFATVVGLLAGLYPAARAARLEPLEALRYE
jgi:ABC-type antimicrobial peptide transport system permease subunit